MAQAGFTPILIYGSGSTGNTPSAGNLTSSASGAELAINYFDGKLFYKDASNNVQVLATKGTGAIGGSTTQIQYNSSGALAGSSNFTFDGSNFTAPNINKVTITAPATSATLTIANGKTLTANNSITLAGTDATTMTFPSTSQTLAGLALAQTFTAAQTFRAANAIRAEAASTQDAMVLAGRAGGTSSYAVTLTPTTLSASRTVTFPNSNTSIPIASQTLTFSGPSAARTYTLPDADSTLAALATAQTFTAAQTFRAANAIRSEAASTQDAVVLAGRAGGTSSYAATITPTTLTASRTVTLPDANTTVPVATQVLTFSGPSAARTITLPDENFSVGFRNIPQSGSDKTTSYSLATGDVGKFVGVGASGSITVPDSTFAAGDVVSIFNNTTGNVTLTMNITTAYIAGTDADKNTITLATRGVATILFISGTVCVVSGNVS